MAFCNAGSIIETYRFRESARSSESIDSPIKASDRGHLINPYQEEPPLVIEDTKPEDMSFGETLDLSRTSAEAKATGDATLPDRPSLFSPATIPVLAMMHINTKATGRNGKIY